MNTLVCALAVLKVFRKDAIRRVFANTEVLLLRNLMGEGVSLTHEEWRILYPELMYSSERFTSLLLEGGTDNDYKWDIHDLLLRVMKSHPLEGNSRLCNKLLTFLSDLKAVCFRNPITLIEDFANQLSSNIAEETLKTYNDLIAQVNLTEVGRQINEITQNYLTKLPGCLSQVSVSGLPKWYNPSERDVDQSFLLHLLFKIDEISDLEIMFAKELVKPKHVSEKQGPYDPHAMLLITFANTLEWSISYRLINFGI